MQFRVALPMGNLRPDVCEDQVSAPPSPPLVRLQCRLQRFSNVILVVFLAQCEAIADDRTCCDVKYYQNPDPVQREKSFKAKRIIDPESDAQVDLVTVELDDLKWTRNRLTHLIDGISPDMRDRRCTGRTRRRIKMPGFETLDVGRKRSLAKMLPGERIFMRRDVGPPALFEKAPMQSPQVTLQLVVPATFSLPFANLAFDPLCDLRVSAQQTGRMRHLPRPSPHRLRG